MGAERLLFVCLPESSDIALLHNLHHPVQVHHDLLSTWVYRQSRVARTRSIASATEELTRGTPPAVSPSEQQHYENYGCAKLRRGNLEDGGWGTVWDAFLRAGRRTTYVFFPLEQPFVMHDRRWG